MPLNPLTNLTLEKFTAFQKLEIELGEGLNVFIGANSTGKTHLLKVLYSACVVMDDHPSKFSTELEKQFLPMQFEISRLVRRGEEAPARIKVAWKSEKLSAQIDNENTGVPFEYEAHRDPNKLPYAPCYIPSKEILAHAPGFRSLYNTRVMPYEKVYADIVDHAYLPFLKSLPASSTKLLELLEQAISGEVVVRGEHFFLKDEKGELEFALISEGFRKLALLWILIRNGSIAPGSILFWDEPETNLNPSLQGKVIEVLLELQRQGVQIFIATHNYVLLKEIHLQLTQETEGEVSDKIRFHSLYHKDGEVACASTSDYMQIEPNLIQDTYSDLYTRDLERAFTRSD